MSVSGVSTGYNYYSYSSQSTSQKDAINQLVKNYTSTSKGVFQPKLDKNSDSVWDSNELQNYASALKKATGRELDVDAIIEEYGNADGKVDSSGQTRINADDALQLSGLQSDWIKVNTNTSSSTSSTSKTSETSDLFDSMSISKKTSFSRVMNRAETQQQLISNFSISGMNGSDMVSLLNSSNDMMVYGKTLRSSYKDSDFYSAMLGQLMNFTV